jgi:hypothetical protein
MIRRDRRDLLSESTHETSSTALAKLFDSKSSFFFGKGLLFLSSIIDRLCLCSEYEQELRKLQVPIPETPGHCASWECQHVPQCFSDFGPHYGTSSMSLASAVIGATDHHWARSELVYLPNMEEYGYRDNKYYLTVSPCGFLIFPTFCPSIRSFLSIDVRY